MSAELLRVSAERIKLLERLLKEAYHSTFYPPHGDGYPAWVAEARELFRDDTQHIADGTVTRCDLPVVQRSLPEIQVAVAWEKADCPECLRRYARETQEQANNLTRRALEIEDRADRIARKENP